MRTRHEIENDIKIYNERDNGYLRHLAQDSRRMLEVLLDIRGSLNKTQCECPYVNEVGHTLKCVSSKPKSEYFDPRKECESCSKKAGSPVLCEDCIKRRYDPIAWIIDLIKTKREEAGKIQRPDSAFYSGVIVGKWQVCDELISFINKYRNDL